MSNLASNELLPNRLNAEPSIFRGCSLPELMLLAGTGLIICIPLCLLICGLFGFVMMGAGIGILCTIAFVFIGATILQKMKRGRPIGYYQIRIRLFLEDKGLVKSQFMRGSRVWDIGRSR